MGIFVKVCPSCNLNNDTGNKHCCNCGEDLTGTQYSYVDYEETNNVETNTCTNKFSTISIIAFTLSIICFLLPLPVVLVYPILIASIVLGIIDISKKNDYRKIGLSIASIVISVIIVMYLINKPFAYVNFYLN